MRIAYERIGTGLPLVLLHGGGNNRHMCLARAANLGFDGIELMVRDPGALDWPAIKQTLQAANLEVPQLVTGELFGADGLCLVTADLDLHQRAVVRAKSVVDLAAYLGAMVNVGRLRGRLDNLGAIPNAWGVAVERLREVVGYAAERGVRIALEPINRYETDFILTAEEGLRMIADLGADNVGLMLDLFHMNIEEACIEDSLLRTGDKLWHVHIADSGRRYPGSGHLIYGPIFETLRQMNYQGYISAEIFPQPDPDTAAEKVAGFSRHIPW